MGDETEEYGHGRSERRQGDTFGVDAEREEVRKVGESGIGELRI